MFSELSAHQSEKYYFLKHFLSLTALNCLVPVKYTMRFVKRGCELLWNLLVMFYYSSASVLVLNLFLIVNLYLQSNYGTSADLA